MKRHTAKITSKSIEQSGLPADFKKAIAEYIWNGFDANATLIELKYDANAVGFINSFSISDNGSGINLGKIDSTFGQFLDSQKTKTYDQNSLVKGKAGKGRFSFTSFCNKASWETIFESEKSDFLKYTITISKEKLQDFETSDRTIPSIKETGTTVNFNAFHSLTEDLLDNENFTNYLASEFGWFLFLNKERDFKIKVNGTNLDYWNIIGDYKEFE